MRTTASASGNDPLDRAEDLVARPHAGDRFAGEQEVVGAHLDQKRRPDRTIEKRYDQLRAVGERQVSRVLVGNVGKKKRPRIS